MLELARRGLADLLTGQMDKQLGGICDVAVYGRSVTYAAQHARTKARDTFNTWYEPWKVEMDADELFRYFNHLRNEVIKDGPPRAIAYRRPIDSEKEFRALAPIMNRISKEKPVSLGLSEVVGIGLYEITNDDGQKMTGSVKLPSELWQNLRIFTYLAEPPEESPG
jgi:hypothetical protein